MSFSPQDTLLTSNRQLRPPNKSADRKVQYNHYLKRLDISLPLRLKREGWPCFELKEQYRMHACIADFPNRNIYDGQLRNGPVTYKTLEQTTPGLRAVLLDIIMEYGTEGDVDPSQYRLTASDAELRLHWIEVYGQRVKDRSPWAVKEHSDVVLNQIMPQLCKYFNDKGEKTSESLMIIAAYNYQVSTVRCVPRAHINADFTRLICTRRALGFSSERTRSLAKTMFLAYSQLTPAWAKNRAWSSSTAVARTETKLVRYRSSPTSSPHFADIPQASSQKILAWRSPLPARPMCSGLLAAQCAWMDPRSGGTI